jgi:hypothetical protein
VVKRVLAALCCIVLGSCAASPKRGGAPMPEPAREAATTGGAAPPMPGSKQDEINQLEQEINVSRLKLALAEPSDSDFPDTRPVPMGTMPVEQSPSCKPHAKNDTCDTSCTLSNSICTNADKICRIAIDLDDDWSRGKCAKANKTCEASKTKCCGCQ